MTWLRHWLWHLHRIVTTPTRRAFNEGYEVGYRNGKFFSDRPWTAAKDKRHLQSCPFCLTPTRIGDCNHPYHDYNDSLLAAEAGPTPGQRPPP